MFLTEPQSSAYEPARFAGLSPRANHFDWALYYEFKDQRERFWREHIVEDAAFRSLAEQHFTAFQRSVDTTLRLLAGVPTPHILDVGLSSEQLDRAILQKTGGRVTVLDVQNEAAAAFDRAFGTRASFMHGDIIATARDVNQINCYDLVYSVGLIEHFPDKTDIVDAHVRLTAPGGLVLLYVPIDTAENRAMTVLAAEWENFGHRELMTPDELRGCSVHPALDILRVEPVGFYSALWARKKVTAP